MSGNNRSHNSCDVAIIGGGPTGSTLSTLIRKYNPDLRVVIIEKSKFPREHVGESQLPNVSGILAEMGCWDKVEAAGFPIKIGASLTWGRNNERWDFDFYPVEKFVDEPRPAKYQGQRRHTAFQVDRAIYDNILLRHAQEMGVELREEVGVEEVLREGDRVTGFKLSTGDTITATNYVDASGAWGVLKRAMGITSWEPKELRNIAIWEYWRNADWAVEIGVGGTRVQVRSLPYGWIWFIPLGPDRTSVGLICPAEHFRNSGLTIEEIYNKALAEQEEIKGLMVNATPEGKLQSCKDWSHLADRLAGENWFICGEACGFADPILAAGLSLAQTAATDLACTILELERGEHPDSWLRDRYSNRIRRTIGQHIRFAQYWYASNGIFSELQDHCQAIASEAGLSLSPAEAWAWLSQGGFAEDNPGQAVLGSFDLKGARTVIDRFSADAPAKSFSIDKNNVFKLDLSAATKETFGVARHGRIAITKCYKNPNGETLPLTGAFGMTVDVLQEVSDLAGVLESLKRRILEANTPPENRNSLMHQCMLALEAMISQGWVNASLDPNGPTLNRQAEWSAIRDGSVSDAALKARNEANKKK